MDRLNTDKYTLKKFGVFMGVAFSVIALIVYIRQRHDPVPWFLVSGAFFAAALIRPPILKPVYICWMRLAFTLSWINTRLLLSVIFYLVVTPIAAVIKLCRVDLLERRWCKKAETYWKKKEDGAFEPAGYERQF